jgi:hypothetical protein
MDLIERIITEKKLNQNFPSLEKHGTIILNFLDLNIIYSINNDIIDYDMDIIFSKLGRYRNNLFFVIRIVNEKIELLNIFYNQKFTRSIRIVTLIKKAFLEININWMVEGIKILYYDSITGFQTYKYITYFNKGLI